MLGKVECERLLRDLDRHVDADDELTPAESYAWRRLGEGGEGGEGGETPSHAAE